MNTLKAAIVEFDSTKYDDLLNVAVEAALAASDIIMEALDKPHRTNYKGKYDLVTEPDQNSENIIKSPKHDYTKDLISASMDDWFKNNCKGK